MPERNRQVSPTRLHRLEGRIIDIDGSMRLVVEANEVTGLGRVSYQINGKHHIKEMPLHEIASLVAQQATGATAPSDLSPRVKHKADGYYAQAREGAIGPFKTFAQAEVAMRDHIETQQLTNSPAR